MCLGGINDAHPVAHVDQRRRQSNPIGASRFHDDMGLRRRTAGLAKALVQRGKPLRRLRERDRTTDRLTGAEPGGSESFRGNIDPDEEGGRCSGHRRLLSTRRMTTTIPRAAVTCARDTWSKPHDTVHVLADPG